jgi:outer membrane protein
MKRKWIFLVCCLGCGHLSAQDAGSQAGAPPLLTLSQAVEQTLKTGDSLALVKQNLDAAQAADALNQAKNGFTVGVALGYGGSKASNSISAPAGFTTAQENPYYNSATNPTGSVTVVPTAAVGSETLNGVLVQNPTASVTAGTPITSVTGSWSTGYQTWPDGSIRNVGTASAKLTQTIWNGYLGGPTQAAADKSSLAYRIAQLTAQANRNSAVLAVKQAFFIVLTDQQNLDLLQATADSWKETLQITQAKFDQQAETAVDVLTAQVSLQSAELNLQGGKQALATARKRLANLMGLSPDTEFRAAPEPDPTAPAQTVEEAVEFGMKTRVEPQIAALNARSSDVDIAAAVGMLIPDVSLTAGVTNYLDLGVGQSTLVGQLGVTVGAALWDAGAYNSTYSQASKTKLGYQTQQHQYTRSIPVDIQDAWNTWQLDLKRRDVAIDNKKAFDQQLEIVRVQFQTGSKALSDLLIAQTNATNADFGLLSAQITAQLDALQLRSLMGL